MVPGTYHFLAPAPGYGLRPFTLHVTPGQTVTKTVQLTPNWASTHLGRDGER